jgi:hypothetical protein
LAASTSTAITFSCFARYSDEVVGGDGFRVIESTGNEPERFAVDSMLSFHDESVRDFISG